MNDISAVNVRRPFYRANAAVFGFSGRARDQFCLLTTERLE